MAGRRARPPPFPFPPLKAQICKRFAADFHASLMAHPGHSTCQSL